MKIFEFVNSVVLDEVAHIEPPDPYLYCLHFTFYPSTEWFGGYSDEPGVRPSVCPSVRTYVRKHFRVRSIV